MNHKHILIILSGILLVLTTIRCTDQTNNESSGYENLNTAKTYARYWWFASEINKEDVGYNLDWLKSHGFGGVELAFVYPLNAFDQNDTSYIPRQEWLSPELSSMIAYAIQYADSIGLGCDITFGTLWPFGDSRVDFTQATQRYGDDEWRQEISKSWEYPQKGYVVDHLTPSNYLPYFSRMMDFLPDADTKVPQAYFIDSWEVETRHLWCDDFDIHFQHKFGYDIIPAMDSIYQPGFEDFLYDYMSLISEKILRFYADFDSTLNANGIMSRGQVSGAPCDLISGYALMDIPESEAMLFEPKFSAIPASAALLAGKPVVSSETFTCLYGWPRDYIREEQTADLKLVADALFANGVNKIIWHGKAHNPAGIDSVNFYASVHLGDEGNLAQEIPAFNSYLEKVSAYMQMGHTYADIAVYLPTEDAWMAGTMPKEKQFKWAWGHYEMRYVDFPEELEGYARAWINQEFLKKATVLDGHLLVGDARFKSLYIDVEYLDFEVLKRLSELASKGLDIVIKQKPKEPGKRKHPEYAALVEQVFRYDNVKEQFSHDRKAFAVGETIPEFWCRKDGEALYVFFASPKSKELRFPVEYGQSLDELTETYQLIINYQNQEYELELVFEPYQSLLYKFENGRAQQIDISFVPETPVVKPRPTDYKAPWLVK